MITVSLIILLLFLLSVGTPVAFALGASAVFGLIVTGEQLSIVPSIFYETFNLYELIAVPLFVLMGQILLYGRVGEHLFSVFNRWVGHLPGGLGIATIISCGFFAAVCGSSTATVATVGTSAIKSMANHNYPKTFAYGMVAGGGTLGILIPPSIPFILYAAITSESVGKLFLAGVLPGIAVILSFIVYVMIKSLTGSSLPRGERFSWYERITFTGQHSAALFLPVVVLGGIYAGLFTPTEAAGAGALYGFILCAFGYRTLSLHHIQPILLSTTRITCMLLFIIAAAFILARVFTTLQVAPALMAFFEANEISKWTFIIHMNLIWLFMGMFMEVASIMLITLPIAFPLAVSLGIDPIWFAVVMVMNMELATISPPIGLNLFVIMGITKEKDFTVIVRGAMPSFFIIASNLIAVMMFPVIATWLPSLYQ